MLAPQYWLDSLGTARFFTLDTSSNQLIVESGNSYANAQIKIFNSTLGQYESWSIGSSYTSSSFFYIMPNNISKPNLTISSRGLSILQDTTSTITANQGSFFNIYNNLYNQGSTYIYFSGNYTCASTTPAPYGMLLDAYFVAGTDNQDLNVALRPAPNHDQPY